MGEALVELGKDELTFTNQVNRGIQCLNQAIQLCRDNDEGE